MLLKLSRILEKNLQKIENPFKKSSGWVYRLGLGVRDWVEFRDQVVGVRCRGFGGWEKGEAAFDRNGTSRGFS